MPQHQVHRGQHPEDVRLFSGSQVALLRAGVADHSFLLTRGYSNDAALKLVGDRYQLDVRQRRAILRAACSGESLRLRALHRVPVERLRGEPLIVDGYNGFEVHPGSVRRHDHGAIELRPTGVELADDK